MDYKQIHNSIAFNPGLYSTRAIILFLREMFNKNSDLSFLPYTDDLTKTSAYNSLMITSKFDWESKYRNKRPAIMVSHGNIISGINGTQGLGRILSVSVDGEETIYSDLISFPIMIECVSEVDTECSALASMANAFLTCDNRILHSLRMQLLGNPLQSPSQQFEKNNISFISSVILNIQLSRKWTSKLISNNVLENIKIKLKNFTEIDINEG